MSPKSVHLYSVSELKLLSHVRFFATPQTVARKVPLPMEFFRQEYQSGLPFPSPWDLPNPGIGHGSPALQADSLPSEPTGKLYTMLCINYISIKLGEKQSTFCCLWTKVKTGKTTLLLNMKNGRCLRVCDDKHHPPDNVSALNGLLGSVHQETYLSCCWWARKSRPGRLLSTVQARRKAGDGMENSKEGKVMAQKRNRQLKRHS